MAPSVVARRVIDVDMRGFGPARLAKLAEPDLRAVATHYGLAGSGGGSASSTLLRELGAFREQRARERRRRAPVAEGAASMCTADADATVRHLARAVAVRAVEAALKRVVSGGPCDGDDAPHVRAVCMNAHKLVVRGALADSWRKCIVHLAREYDVLLFSEVPGEEEGGGGPRVRQVRAWLAEADAEAEPAPRRAWTVHTSTASGPSPSTREVHLALVRERSTLRVARVATFDVAGVEYAPLVLEIETPWCRIVFSSVHLPPTRTRARRAQRDSQLAAITTRYAPNVRATLDLPFTRGGARDARWRTPCVHLLGGDFNASGDDLRALGVAAAGWNVLLAGAEVTSKAGRAYDNWLVNADALLEPTVLVTSRVVPRDAAPFYDVTDHLPVEARVARAL